MAKVYSWAINNRTYAYIVSPTNTNEAYVGTELKGNNLKIVSDWAQNATDTQYDTQFAKMVALCASKGYNVSFESALSYRTVETTCDNLRGPAGRGIQSVKFDRTDETLSWYKMIYDDGTEDEFFVKNGTNGKDGADGKDGAQGDTGISSKLIMVYTSGRNANGELNTPDRPEGGSFNFNTFETTYPDGWAPSDKALTPPVWMSSRTFTSSALSTDKEWSYPTQITGENGSPGADGTNTEFIFKLTSIKPTESEVSELYSDPDKSGVVPNSNWKASPEGVDEENKTEYYCIRRRNLTTGKWGKWEGAYIWSKYGVNGQDGDGVQYIFMRTKKGTPPINPTPMGYDDPQSEIYANYQNKDTEWVPASGTSYYNYNNEIVNLKGDEYWSDNVQGVDATYQWEWVSVRKYRKNSSNNQHEWKAFDTPALWAKFGEDGKHATSIRRLYCLTPGTDEVPEAPSDNVITGDWGNGFPKGYRKDENVVWAIEAEIWAHNNEFVLSYMVVSATDEKGNILPPIDVTTANTKTVESIPAEKYADENIKYLIFNNEYYEWKGGWCEPFLVTGVKGDSGEPVNYTTRYFCAGYNNVLPLIPDTHDKNDFEDRYKYQDVEGNTVYWYRSPNTSLGGVDGSIDDTGKERRWYECLVYINGWDNKIIEYGEIGPLNPRDGEIKDGRYCEFRFGITKEAIVTPYVEQTTSEGLPIRNPKMKTEEGSGWYSSEDNIPAVPVEGALWVIWAYIESDGTMKKDSNGKVWYGPTKISGARGPEGPVGPRGFTGVPGVSTVQRFCLGTYGSKDNNTTGESYFENGSGYFGSTNWSGTTDDKIVPVGELKGWYTAQSAPYTNIIECSTEDDLNTIIANPQNRGRVVKHTYQKSGTTYYDYFLIHDTFLGGSEVGHPDKAAILTGKTKEEVEKLIEDENWGIYLWCIQGSEVWKTDEETGDSILLGVEWGNPFKMQGSNGIRGIAGNRGQTIYPMGVYNHEEVYITDANKAPYVYDPNDGLYYIYNVVDIPWVGKLPTGYQNIMKHPSDIYVKGNANFKIVSTDPLKNTSQDTSVKYLCYNDNYYVWQDGKYIMASKYKYSMDGTYGNWIPSQGGATPSENYANNTNNNEPPAWVRMESFDALYTNVGVIANGMIGSAVYNNEFMFSQQGVDQNSGKTNYANVLNKDDEGFLSAYHYSEAANEKGWHWRDENGNYMDVSKINPYEKNNGTYIHKFMPNVCINFATGQMWLQCGKLQFGATSGNVYTSGEVDTQIDEKVSAATKSLSDALDEFKKDIQGQSDGYANTYYQDVDPSQSESWSTDDAENHVGDLWYDTGDKRSYIFARGELNNDDKFGKKSDNLNLTNYYWAASDVPESVYNAIDGRSKVFVNEPEPPYHVGDLWFVHDDKYSGFTFFDGTTGVTQGTCMVCMSSSETAFNTEHWAKRDHYADEAQVKNAQDELDKMSKKLDDWDNDGLLNPTELKELAKEYETIVTEFPIICEQAETAGLDTSGGTPYYNYSQVYNNVKYITESYYLKTEDGKYVNATATTDTATGEFIEGGDCVVIQDNYEYYQEYYKCRQELLQAISVKLNEKINNIPDTSWLESVFGSGTTEFYGGAVLSNFLGVKNQSNNIAGFLNGSSEIDEFKGGDGESIMMMGLGVPSSGISGKITLYPWSCTEAVIDNYTIIYTTIDYADTNGAQTKDNTVIKTYAYVDDEFVECPGFSYLKNPETSSSDTSTISEITQTIYRTINNGTDEKTGYTYNRATSLSAKTEDSVKFTPTRFYSDGTVIINNLITTNGDFNGEINANGYFNGTVSSDKGNLKHYNINRSLIKNSDIVLRHDFEETEDNSYENYNTLTCTDRNDNVLLKLGPADISYTSQQYTVSVGTVNSYHKNHNGNNTGQWYGTSNTWNSMSSFKVNGGESITIPAIDMYMWIWTSGNKQVRLPSYGLRVSYYSGSTYVSSETLRNYGVVSAYKGGGKGGYSYFSVVTNQTNYTVPTGITMVKLEYCWQMHLHTYAWLGADKSAGEITITPQSNILVQNGQRYNIIEMGGNGIRIMQGKTHPLLFQVLPTGVVIERGDMGIRVYQNPNNTNNNAIYIMLGGQGYREMTVDDSGYLKLKSEITNFSGK